MTASSSSSSSARPEKILPIRFSQDGNGLKMSIDYKIHDILAGTPEERIAIAVASLPQIDAAYEDTGLVVLGKRGEASIDDRTIVVTLEAGPATKPSAPTPSKLNVWIEEGSGTSYSTTTQKDKNNNRISVKYQPPGGAVVGDDKKYNRTLSFPTTESRITRTFRRQTNTDPKTRQATCLNTLSTDKVWKCTDYSYTQTGTVRWEERVSFLKSANARGFPEEVGFWENPEDGTVPADVTLPADTPASIGTTTNGTVRPDLFGTTDFASELGITLS